MKYTAAMFELTFITITSIESWQMSHSQSGTYYVVSENCNATAKFQESECHTLASYMSYRSESPTQYFNSYETYIFENGIHFPLKNYTVTITNVANLSFIGPIPGNNLSAVIDCQEESFGLICL